jgi:hypothetical protein
MNNVLMRKIVLTTSYQPLSPKASEVVTVLVRLPSANKKEAVFAGEGGTEVEWDPGSQFELKRVNLAEIRVKGRAGDIVVLAGGTW